MRDIRVGDIEDFRAWLPKTLNQKTVYNLLGMLHKIFKDALRRRDILHLPDFPQIQLNEPVTRWIDEEEQNRVLANIEDPVYRTFYYFLMKQGCRPGEARALRWEKIDFKNNLVTIDAAFDRDIFRPHTKEEIPAIFLSTQESKKRFSSYPAVSTGLCSSINSGGR